MAVKTPRSIVNKIRRLDAIKNRYGAEERDEKLVVLEDLRNAAIVDPKPLFDYHETLLFLRAYPDNERIFRIAVAECNRFTERIDRLRKAGAGRVDELADTGIAGTDFYYSYDLVTAANLVRWFGDAIEIDWEAMDDTAPLDDLVPVLAEWMESDGLDLSDLTSEEWISLRAGGGRSAYRWIVENVSRLAAPLSVKRHFFDAIDLPVRWKLGTSPASRTLLRVPGGAPFYHDRPLLRKVRDFREAITEPMAPLEPLPRKEGRRLIRAIRSALAVRHRSLYPIEYADPREVLVAEPGRGYRLVLYGMDPEHRLPLESDYGALLVKNGFPVGYGVGAMIFDQMEIAVNIFDSWRSGEAGYVFAQFVRAFRAHFGCSRFKIVRYQVGHENEEGIQSGSFWFYYKLGFVPKDPAVRRLAESELRKIRKNPSYRCSAGILRRLAVSDLYYSLKGDPTRIPDDFPLSDLSVGTTKMIGDKFGGDGKRAVRECAAGVATILDCAGWQNWPKWERDWFARLSPDVARIDGLERWSASERRDLAALMRAKGKAGETEYVRRMIAMPKLRKALEKAAKDGAP